MDSKEQWRRKMACCSSQPACPACPLRPENAHRSLKDLAMDALLGPG